MPLTGDITSYLFSALLRFAAAIEWQLPKLLRPGGDLLIKILDGPEAQAAVKRLGKRFDSAKTVKCNSTRKGSTEKYLLARGFEGAG